MSDRPKVRATTPLLVVADLDRAIDFYCNKLGFIEPTRYGEPACFAMLNRDGFDLMLGLAEPDSTARPNGGDGTWDLWISITDVAAEIEALAAAGITTAKGPTDAPYGFREIEVLDPDGHRICLAQDLASEPWLVAQIWDGTLEIGGRQLRLVLKTAPSAGGLAGRLDSVDQGAYDLPLDWVRRNGDRLRFALAAISAAYEGSVAADDVIDGEWTQRGQAFPLTFRRRM